MDNGTNSPMNVSRCSNCILSATYPGISFDSAGKCSLCSSYRISAEPRGEAALRKAVESYRGIDGDHDCIVAVSGGRDSSYILWYAVKRLGLKPLGICTDNGYVPEHTYRNLENAGRALDVDIRIEKYSALRKTFPGMLKAWIRKPSAATVSLLCTGCTYGRRLILPRISQEKRIHLMLVGGGEPEQSFAEPLLLPEGAEYSRFNMMRGFAREVLSNPRLVLSLQRMLILGKDFSMRYLENLYLKMLRIEYPKVKVFPFLYTGWDEKTIMDTITGEMDWDKGDICGTSWRSDCEIAPLKNYIYGRMLGFHKVDEILAGMVRMGQLSREEALVRLETESRINLEYYDRFLIENGSSLKELDEAIDKALDH